MREAKACRPGNVRGGCFVYPLLSYISANLQEYGNTLLIRASRNSAMPDPSTLVSSADLADPHAPDRVGRARRLPPSRQAAHVMLWGPALLACCWCWPGDVVEPQPAVHALQIVQEARNKSYKEAKQDAACW